MREYNVPSTYELCQLAALIGIADAVSSAHDEVPNGTPVQLLERALILWETAHEQLENAEKARVEAEAERIRTERELQDKPSEPSP